MKDSRPVSNIQTFRRQGAAQSWVALLTRAICQGFHFGSSVTPLGRRCSEWLLDTHVVAK